MAKFLDAIGTTHYLEELVRQAGRSLVLISPELKFSGRTKELLAEKNRVEVRIVYGRNDLPPEEINWLRTLGFVRTSFCRNLRAQCYLNEESCLVTSLSLYDFSQVMNHEMGVLLSLSDDPELYQRARDEAERIVASAEEVRITVERVNAVSTPPVRRNDGTCVSKLSTHRLAKKLGLKTHELLDGLERLGAIQVAAGHKQLTPQGARLGGEIRSSARFGEYFVWPEKLELAELAASG